MRGRPESFWKEWEGGLVFRTPISSAHNTTVLFPFPESIFRSLSLGKEVWEAVIINASPSFRPASKNQDDGIISQRGGEDLSRSPPLSCSKIPSPPPPTEENAKGKCRRRQREPGFPFQPFHPTSSYAPCCGLKGTSLERRHDFSGLPRGRGGNKCFEDCRRRGLTS